MTSSTKTISTPWQPIGIFDSGIGGLTVAAALQRLLPDESFYYVGDTARVPYGGKSAQTVARYSQEIIELLLAQNAKLIVAACNTASALALPQMSHLYDLPLIGVLKPSAKAALARTTHGRIGVIATKATVASKAYEKTIQQLDSKITLFSQPTPLLVPLIEEGCFDDPVTKILLQRYLKPLLAKEIDTLILGCTHYPLLSTLLQELVGDGVTLVDSAEHSARAVAQQLREKSLLRRNTPTPSSSEKSLQIHLTDSSPEFLSIVAQRLQLKFSLVSSAQDSLSSSLAK